MTTFYKSAKIVRDFRPRKRDNFGRLLADVYADGKDIGQAMLRRGLAVPYRKGR